MQLCVQWHHWPHVPCKPVCEQHPSLAAARALGFRPTGALLIHTEVLTVAPCATVQSQPLELLKTRFQLNHGAPMQLVPAIRGVQPGSAVMLAPGAADCF